MWGLRPDLLRPSPKRAPPSNRLRAWPRRGEGYLWGPHAKRGRDSVPPANLAAPVREEAQLFDPARRGGISGLEVVDDHPARREIRRDVPDRGPHHLHPTLRNPVGVAVVKSGHNLALEQPKQTLGLGLVVHRGPVEGRP